MLSISADSNVLLLVYDIFLVGHNRIVGKQSFSQAKNRRLEIQNASLLVIIRHQEWSWFLCSRVYWSAWA